MTIQEPTFDELADGELGWSDDVVAAAAPTLRLVAAGDRLSNNLGISSSGPEIREPFAANRPSVTGRRIGLFLFVLAAAGAMLVMPHRSVGMYAYGTVALGILAVKLVAAHGGREQRLSVVRDLRVAAVVPVYNEDPVAFRACLESLLDQSMAIEEIWVIDDGSSSIECYADAVERLERHAGATVIRCDANRGKRHAMAEAFAVSTADVFLTVDSDTVLNRYAAEELSRAFSDPKAMAATGTVRALNARANLLTRLIDLRYANAFLFERAAYSRVGSVLCCCGSLSMYRASVVKENLEDFVTQTFLGSPVQFGDDRRLTNYCLTEGRVLFIETALAFTAVPQRLNHYLRQQNRWNKSFFRESFWVLRNMSYRTWPWRITAVELTMWFVLTGSLVVTVIVRPALVGGIAIASYFAQTAFAAYARSVRIIGTGGTSNTNPWISIALAPLYSILHILFLVPVRFWSLFTISRGSWGTRATVEVAIAAP